MSYILDALKKVEQKREREEPAKLLTFSVEPMPERKKWPLWPYLLLAALLINAGAIIWWIGPWRPDKQITPAEPVVVQQPVIAVPKEAENREQSRPGDMKEAMQEKVVSRPPASVAVKETQNVSLPASEKTPVADRTSAEPKAQALIEKGAAVAERVFNLNELPSSVKGALPGFKVSGHAYSPDPQTRVVRINDKILQEGQELAPGLKVEEIIPGGIIFSYQGYRFRIGVNENR